ncbi:MAG: aminopeptidase P N-terminal domain-containing protein, partial [Sphingomonadales bacterium]
MKYQRIPTSLFIKNRKKFTASMKPGSIAIFHSNDEVPRNGDAFHKFKQNSDLFYLSGIDQEETILVLFPDCPNPLYREMLFIKETSAQIAIWDGARLMPEEASAASGIERVFWYHEFKKTIHAAFLMAETIYMNLNENDRSTDTVPANAFRFAHEIKYRYPAHNYARSAPILAQCRMVKEQEEIDLISEAVNITRAGFERLLTFVKPGVWEYEI